MTKAWDSVAPGKHCPDNGHEVNLEIDDAKVAYQIGYDFGKKQQQAEVERLREGIQVQETECWNRWERVTARKLRALLKQENDNAS